MSWRAGGRFAVQPGVDPPPDARAACRTPPRRGRTPGVGTTARRAGGAVDVCLAEPDFDGVGAEHRGGAEPGPRRFPDLGPVRLRPGPRRVCVLAWRPRCGVGREPRVGGGRPRPPRAGRGVAVACRGRRGAGPSPRCLSAPARPQHGRRACGLPGRLACPLGHTTGFVA